MTGSAGTGLAVEDRLALSDLVHRYAAHVDDLDLDGAAALFADDGVLATASPPEHLGPVEEHVGPTAVAQALAAVAGLDATVHAVTGVVLDPGGDADRAVGRIGCQAHHVSRRDGTPGDVTWAVVYRDRYVRTVAGWRFARREVHVQYVATATLRAARTRGGQP